MELIDQIIAQGIPPMDSQELGYQPSMGQPMNVPMRPEPKMIQDGGVIQKTFQQMNQDKHDESKQNIWMNLFNEIQKRGQTTGADVSQSILRSATPAFNKYASPQEVATERMKQELTPYSELLKIKSVSERAGGSTPAVLQINAAVQQHKQMAEEAAAKGDMQTAQRHIDEANQIMQIGKVYDKGVSPYGVPQSGTPLNQQIGQNAIQLSPAAIPGYGQAIGSIEAAKKGMAEEATQSVKDIHEPSREGAKAQHKANVEIGSAAEIERQKKAGAGEITDVQKREIGKAQMRPSIEKMASLYNELEQAGAAVSTKQDWTKNLGASLAGSTAGQYLGKKIGSAEQSIRNKINNQIPAIINDIRQTTGMSAKAMDSNAELQFYLKQLGDQDADIESRRDALRTIQEKYLGKGEAKASGFDIDAYLAEKNIGR